MHNRRFHTPAEIMLALDLGKKLRAGQIRLPSEIAQVRREIAERQRLFAAFYRRLGVADATFANEAVRLMFLKDALYSRWIREEAQGLIG